MDYTSLITGIGVGLTIGAFAFHISRRLDCKLIDSQRELIAAQTRAFTTLARKLAALRANAYLTNELGHRVRYFKASAEVRARAEAGDA